MKPQHVKRIYGEQKINSIAPIGSTGVARTDGTFGTSYLQPGEFERLKAEGVQVVTMAEIECLEKIERSQSYDDPRQTTLFDFLA